MHPGLEEHQQVAGEGKRDLPVCLRDCLEQPQILALEDLVVLPLDELLRPLVADSVRQKLPFTPVSQGRAEPLADHADLVTESVEGEPLALEGRVELHHRDVVVLVHLAPSHFRTPVRARTRTAPLSTTVSARTISSQRM